MNYGDCDLAFLGMMQRIFKELEKGLPPERYRLKIVEKRTPFGVIRYIDREEEFHESPVSG